MSKQCFTWSQLAEEWIGAAYQWADVCILIQAAGGGGGNAFTFDLPPHEYLPPAEVAKDRLSKKEYRRFIELVCRVNGITSTERKMRKEKGEVEVTLSEIQRLYEDVKKKVTLKQIRREDI
jgi:hypothetical protein